MKSPIVVKLTHTESETGILSFSLSNTNKKHREQDLSSPFHFFLNPIEERKKESVKKKKEGKDPRAGGTWTIDDPPSVMSPRPVFGSVRDTPFSLSRERAHTSATKPWRDGRANNNEDNQSAVGRKGILWGGGTGWARREIRWTNVRLCPLLFVADIGSSLSVRSTSQPVLRACIFIHDDRETATWRF